MIGSKLGQWIFSFKNIIKTVFCGLFLIDAIRRNLSRRVVAVHLGSFLQDVDLGRVWVINQLS